MLLPMLIDTVTILLANQTPSVVKVSHQGPGFELTVNGKPFLVKGAGGDGSKSMLAAAGANSFRTWGSDNLDAQLDEAQKLGLKVTVGIWLGHEEQGFSYNDPQAVEDQFQKAKAAILKYKNHPAVLMWGIGNEMEGYAAGDNPKIWRAVEDIAHEAKKQDPNHPTMTVIAEIGGKKVPSINTYCPDIDIVGINSYGGVASLPTRYKEAGGVKPYIVTEFGPPGVWESA
jgi:beta-galactosidase/beta-glucuronidase